MTQINEIRSGLILMMACIVLSISGVNAEIPISSSVQFIPQAFDVIDYNADLDLTQAPDPTIMANVQIKIFWVDDPADNLFYFHLDAISGDTMSLSISQILYDGNPCQYEQRTGNDGNYFAVLPPDGSIRDTAVITVNYFGKMSEVDAFGGVHSIDSCLFSVGVGLSNPGVSSSRNWLACYDHPSDKAVFTFNFKTSENHLVASNGIKYRDTLIDGFRHTTWKSDLPTATNLMTFAVAEFVSVQNDYDGLPIVIYTNKQDSIATASVYRKVPMMIETMEQRYGKYPFEKVGYYNAPLESGAMEHQSMITMNETEIRDLFSRKDSLNETAAHELSHQWFGNLVTPFDYRDAWFNEGFATFASAVWLEDALSFSSYLFKMSDYIYGYIDYLSKYESVFPLYDFERNSPSSNYPGTIYYKGAAVAGMLRYELGDSLFFGSIRDFLNEYKNKNMTTQMLQSYLELKSGRDLSLFFDQWIYGKGYPVVNVSVKKSKANQDGLCSASITINQIQPDEWGLYGNFPIEFDFLDLTGKKRNIILRVNSKSETFYLDSLPNFGSPTINRGQSVRTLLKVDRLVTNVDDAEFLDIGLNVYPNPAKDKIHISCNRNLNFNEILLSDISGRIVGKFDASSLNDSGYQNINLQSLEDGTYYLSFILGDKIISLSFIRLQD